MTGVLLVHRDEPNLCRNAVFSSEKGDCLENAKGAMCLVDYEHARGSGTVYKAAHLLLVVYPMTTAIREKTLHSLFLISAWIKGAAGFFFGQPKKSKRSNVFLWLVRSSFFY